MVNDLDSSWFRLICSLWEDVDSEVLRRLFSNFIINANFYGWDIQEKALAHRGGIPQEVQLQHPVGDSDGPDFRL